MTDDVLIHGKAKLKFRKLYAPVWAQVAPTRENDDAPLVYLVDLDPEALHALVAAWIADIYETAGAQNPWVKVND